MVIISVSRGTKLALVSILLFGTRLMRNNCCQALCRELDLPGRMEGGDFGDWGSKVRPSRWTEVGL